MMIGTDAWILSNLFVVVVFLLLWYNCCLCNQPKMVSDVLFNAFILEDITTWF